MTLNLSTHFNNLNLNNNNQNQNQQRTPQMQRRQVACPDAPKRPVKSDAKKNAIEDNVKRVLNFSGIQF
jgi:hypothetical protein